MRLRAIWLPVRLQVVVPQLIHSKTSWITDKQHENTSVDLRITFCRDVYRVYRMKATTLPGSRFPEPSLSSPTALGLHPGVFWLEWSFLNYIQRQFTATIYFLGFLLQTTMIEDINSRIWLAVLMQIVVFVGAWHNLYKSNYYIEFWTLLIVHFVGEET